MEQIIQVDHLTKFYGAFKALDDLSFQVKKGEILGLLGPNGSGKTTTIHCILSLLNFEQGSITILGKKMNPDCYDIKKEIGVVFQEVAVFDQLTVYENINYFCGLYVQDKQKRAGYVEQAIRLVGLEDFRKFRPKQLSGGLLRRLNIACGIAHKPSIIFFDEPTVAVDPQSRNHILEGIKKLNRDGATIIYTSHYMEEVEQLCSRIIIMDHGKIIASGTKEKLKELVSIEEKVTVELDAITSLQLEKLRKQKTVKEVGYEERILTVIYQNGDNNLGDLVDFLKEQKLAYHRIFSELPTLNDVFLELTGKELRDQ